VRVYTRYRAATGRTKKTGPGAGPLVMVLAAGVACWFAWHRGWLTRDHHQARAIALSSNAPAATPRSAPVLPSARAATIAGPILPAPIKAPPTPPSSKSAAVLEAQIALDRLAISPGSVDGVLGSQTRAALQAFQLREGLAPTGDLDTNTRARLTLSAPALGVCALTASDAARLLPVGSTWLAKSEQDRLDYETLLECVAERSHAHPNLIRRLNPALDWDNIPPGTEVVIPRTDRDAPAMKAAFVRIRLSDRTLEAFDSTLRLLAHFPCSIARQVEKRPVGELHVAVIAPNPNYTFDPDVFPESAEARELARKLVLPPGPNNPVGTVWIGLDKPGYGIHGTPRPEEVGRTESHGCFRLANWNAEYLLQLVTVGTPVKVEP